MDKLSDIIKAEIEQSGPLSLQDYWNLCQSHPDYGYYMRQDPLGREGDFITAPEISQMFGEMLGIWVADMWMKLAYPNTLHLVECGAGRGTMMEDILRATKNIPGFHQALKVHIVETSPYLKSMQQSKLGSYGFVTWSKILSDVPEEGPIIILGNEFLDALPIRQIAYVDAKWYERVVGVENGEFVMGRGPDIPFSTEVKAENGSVFEFSPVRDAMWEQICERIRKQSGAALMIDYGHGVPAFGDTLQAVRKHQFCDIFDEPGSADITSHVNFGQLAELGKDLSPRFTTQRQFLLNMGIEMRYQTLLKHATEVEGELLSSGLERLIASEQMGDIFKVLCISEPDHVVPAGFE